MTLEQLEVRPDHLTRAPRECGGADQRPGNAGAALMPSRGVDARSSRQERDDKLGDVIESLGGGDTTPAEKQPGGEEQAEDGPPGERDQEAAVVCHLCRFRRL